ncbi:MAG: hypothetical protein ACKJR1_11255 [Limisphaerales bacterium]|tara:strand:+ start:515 stop:697 length:183 start_codon:yes stop_codon:yes gene_type:complete
MKLIQLIKHATCMAALSAFMVGCGGETEEELTGEPDDAPPTPGEGPGVGEEGTEGSPEGN